MSEVSAMRSVRYESLPGVLRRFFYLEKKNVSWVEPKSGNLT